MHVPAGGLSPIHFLQAPSTELLTILKTTLRSQCTLPPPPPREGSKPPPHPWSPLCCATKPGQGSLCGEDRACLAAALGAVWGRQPHGT